MAETDARMLSESDLHTMRASVLRWSMTTEQWDRLDSWGAIDPTNLGSIPKQLIEHIDVLTEENARLIAIVCDLGESHPYTSDEFYSYCVHCREGTPDNSYDEEKIVHATDCLWVRARVALAASGTEEGEA